MTNLNLLVIRAKHPAKLAEFYRCLGLEFLLEQHGTGTDPPTKLTLGCRAVLVDPEGHRVELLEAHSLST